MHTVDYIIVGQGLAGTCLAIELLNLGKSVAIIDDKNETSSSKVAAGIFNPITGRTNQPTWLAREVFSCMHQFYSHWEKQLNTKFLNHLPIYRPFVSSAEWNKWPEETNEWILKVDQALIYNNVFNDYGGLTLKESGFLNSIVFLNQMREYLKTKAQVLCEKFDLDSFSNRAIIRYKNLEASKIIFCDGCEALSNPFFSWLPIRKLKGELITVEADIPKDVIINRGIFSVPLYDDKFLIGSTYLHDVWPGNTEAGIANILERSKKLFKSKLKVVSTSWGHRPTTVDRRPFLGSHPNHENICIFNGLGTKGVSLAPFFAVQMAGWLSGKSLLKKEINIERFYSLSFKSNLI